MAYSGRKRLLFVRVLRMDQLCWRLPSESSHRKTRDRVTLTREKEYYSRNQLRAYTSSEIAWIPSLQGTQQPGPPTYPD